MILEWQSQIVAHLGEERDLRLHTKKMQTLFDAADESGDGVIATCIYGSFPK